MGPSPYHQGQTVPTLGRGGEGVKVSCLRLPMASHLHRSAAPAACSWQPRWGCASARPSSGASEVPLCRALLLAHMCRH